MSDKNDCFSSLKTLALSIHEVIIKTLNSAEIQHTDFENDFDNMDFRQYTIAHLDWTFGINLNEKTVIVWFEQPSNILMQYTVHPEYIELSLPTYGNDKPAPNIHNKNKYSKFMRLILGRINAMVLEESANCILHHGRDTFKSTFEFIDDFIKHYRRTTLCAINYAPSHYSLAEIITCVGFPIMKFIKSSSSNTYYLQLTNNHNHIISSDRLQMLVLMMGHIMSFIVDGNTFDFDRGYMDDLVLETIKTKQDVFLGEIKDEQHDAVVKETNNSHKAYVDKIYNLIEDTIWLSLNREKELYEMYYPGETSSGRKTEYTMRKSNKQFGLYRTNDYVAGMIDVWNGSIVHIPYMYTAKPDNHVSIQKWNGYDHENGISKCHLQCLINNVNAKLLEHFSKLLIKPARCTTFDDVWNTVVSYINDYCARSVTCTKLEATKNEERTRITISEQYRNIDKHIDVMTISVIDRDLLMTIPAVEVSNTYGSEYYKQILQLGGQLSRILCDCQDEGIVKKPDDDINMTMGIIRMCCAVPGCNWITITQNPKLAIVKCCGVEMLRCNIIDRNDIITTITEEAFRDEIHLGTVYRLINHLICSFGYTHIKFDMSNVNYQKIYEFIHTYLYQHLSNSDLCRYCAACDTDMATVIFDERDIPKKELLRIQYTDIGLKLILCSELIRPLQLNTNWKIKYILPILREFWEYSKYPEPVVTSEEFSYPDDIKEEKKMKTTITKEFMQKEFLKLCEIIQNEIQPILHDVALLGGHWSSTGNAEFMGWYVVSAASNRGRNFGACLLNDDTLAVWSGEKYNSIIQIRFSTDYSNGVYIKIDDLKRHQMHEPITTNFFETLYIKCINAFDDDLWEEIGYPDDIKKKKKMDDIDESEDMYKLWQYFSKTHMRDPKMKTFLPSAPSFENVDRLVFNGPATIVYWNDGTMTVVKATKGEKIDPEKGFAMAALKKVNGNAANYMRKMAKLFKKAEIIESTRKKKTKKTNTDIVATADTPKKTTKKKVDSNG